MNKIDINKKTGLNLIWFLYLLLFGITYCGQAQQYDFREYSDGLPQPYVYSLVQDTQGYLWAGTGNGLSRYDGMHFTTFTTNDSLAGNFITCSFKDGNDLWFGHMNGNVSHYDGRNFHPVADLDLQSRITDIKKSPNGEIWASSLTGGLVNIMDTDNTPLLRAKYRELAVHTFIFISGHEILVGSANGLKYIRIRSTGDNKMISHIHQIPDAEIQEIIKMKNDSGYYVATVEKGIFRINRDGDHFGVRSVTSTLHPSLSGVQDILEDNESNLWISTFGNGLVKLHGLSSGVFKEIKLFDQSTGFTSNNVKYAYQDREGNIWSGNYGKGLTQLIKRPISHFTFDKDRYGTAIHSVHGMQDVVWLATNKGLLKVNRSSMEVMAFYNTRHGLPDDPISALYTDKGAELWLGTKNSGIYRMIVGKEEFIPYNIADGDLENSITAITGKKDQVWIGTKKGVCNIHTKTDDIRWYTIGKGGLPHNFINHLLIGSTGRIWITTPSNTLVYIKDDKVKKLPIESEKGVTGLGPVTEDRDSAIWVGSNGAGIFRILSDSVANITTRHGLYSDYCYSLLADGNGNIWAGHRSGISKIKTTNYFVQALHEQAGIHNGGEFKKNAIFQDAGNKVWLGSNNGLWVYNPAMEDQGSVPTLLHITSIQVNDEEVNPDQDLVLPPGDHKIYIEFLGIHLKAPEHVNYQYQMVGYDQSPENTQNTHVTYPQLNEGEYTFTLKAYTGDGVATASPQTLNITIRTPIWKQWWFYGIIFMLLIMAVVIIIKRREYKYRQEKRILEAKVEERTSALASKNAQLTEKQKTITAQNEELIKYRKYLEELVEERTHELVEARDRAEESDKLKTAFLENLSHEIRTPMNSVLGFLSLLKEPELDDLVKNEFLDNIKKSSERMFDTINDIVEISKIESGQVTVRQVEVNVVALMDEHLSSFSFKAEEKGLHLELSSDISDPELYIMTDKFLIDSIFTKIMNNAIKFTNTGTIEIGNYVQNNTITFYVSDTGVGIPVDRQEVVFDRFVQADVSGSRDFEGSGLGLSIVKAYIEMLEGKVWFESVPGDGSTFYFSVSDKPFKKEVAHTAVHKEPNGLPEKELTILFAEDDKYSFMYIENVLKEHNITLLHATNGEEVLQTFRENPDIPLILMDIKMPVMSGLEATSKIREINKTIPIIAQTAYAMAGDKEKAFEAGCTDYITKPVNGKELLQLIKKYVHF